MSLEILYSPLHEQARLLDDGSLSSEELVRLSIERTEAVEPRLNSYVSFLPERALEQARERDRERRAGTVRGPLHGIPVSLKDVFDTRGIPTSAGARFLESHVPDADAEVWRRLEAAGAVLLGKSNLNKFAGGESGANPDFGDIQNPWNLDYSPSGSSGGSAAQVAAGAVSLSVGSDNGGSVRNPACVCNLVGLKPTHGRISTEGMFPRAYTIDHVGTLTRDVRDAALALQVLAGHRDGDTTTTRHDVPRYDAGLGEPITGMRLGVDRAAAEDAEPVVRSVLESALGVLGELGAEIVDVTLPSALEMTEAMYLIFLCEWGAAHEPWMRERPEEYAGGGRGALLIPAVDYLDAQRARTGFRGRAAEAMRNLDALVSPTYPIARRSHRALPVVDGRRLDSMDVLRFTMPHDLLGLPAVSIPAGFDGDDGPIGIQLAARAFEEPALLRIAQAYESATPWHRRHPQL